MPFLSICCLDLIIAFEYPPTVGAICNPLHDLMEPLRGLVGWTWRSGTIEFGVEGVDMVGVFSFFSIMILILYVQISYPPRVKVELLNEGEIQPITNTSCWNTLSNVHPEIRVPERFRIAYRASRRIPRLSHQLVFRDGSAKHGSRTEPNLYQSPSRNLRN
jgi:hypothetical protein